MNLKSERREKLSNFIVKPEEKYYNSPGMNLYESGIISFNIDYNIRIPGIFLEIRKRKNIVYLQVDMVMEMKNKIMKN